MWEWLEMFVVGVIAVLVGLVHIPYYEVDKDIEPYYKEFIQIANEACPNKTPYREPGRVIIKFDSLDDRIAGQCQLTLNIATIKIDWYYWNIYNEAERFELIMHELTHCFLGNFLIARFPFHSKDDGHYMYPVMRNISRETTKNQLIEVIKQNCS